MLVLLLFASKIYEGELFKYEKVTREILIQRLDTILALLFPLI